MIGTIMVCNVFFKIIPAHWELDAGEGGGARSGPGAEDRGKQRSVHNNYLTLPVVFTMIGPLPVHLRDEHAWLVLVVADGDRRLDPALLQPAARRADARGDPGDGGGCSSRSRSRSSRTSRSTPARPVAAMPRSRRSWSSAASCHRRPDARGFDAAAGGHLLRHARADRRAAAAIERAGGRTPGDAARERDRDDRRGARGARRLDRAGAWLKGSGRAGDRAVRLRFVARFEEGAAPRRSTRSADPAVRGPDHPLPLERRVELDPVGRPGSRRRAGERDGLPHPWRARPLPGRRQARPSCSSPYGYCNFASKAGQLWANYFATFVEGEGNLRELGR